MTELNGVRLPAGYNGCGCHDTPGCYAATMSYAEAVAHANDLKAHGVTVYKLFVSGGNKVDRARAYVDNGIVVIVRDWREQPWGRPPASWVMPADQVQMYASAGVQLFEIAGNEVNIGCEWSGTMPQDPAVLAKAAVDAFAVALNSCANIPGAYPLLTSCTPGGNVDHRRVYPAIVAELNSRGLMPMVKHIAIHPRPHNNPPDTKWSATNTVTFDEWRWIRDQFPAGVYFWATEHGYSLNDDQNHGYPKITLDLHTDYNWELDVRMNPANVKATELQLAGACHWFEAGWGAWGAWPKDALRDCPTGEMPAPSPLWVRMGDRHNELAFSRYGGTPPPDPPPDPPPGALKIYDSSGAERDWAWLHGTYGTGVHIDQATGTEHFAVTELREVTDGSNVCFIKAPPGTPVIWNWPDAPDIPATYNREWGTRGDIDISDAGGGTDFGMWTGSKYWPNNPPYCGPHNIWCGLAGQSSEQFVGEGMLDGTNHYHLEPTWAWVELPPEPPEPDFRKPFDGSYPITCDFACHKSRVPPSTSPGVDYATPLYTKALAVREGIVVGRGSNSTSGTWLMLLCHVCEDGWYLVTYRHLSSYTVPYWAYVQAGQQIGKTGNTGNSTGPHLHVDVKRLDLGKYVDPEALW